MRNSVTGQSGRYALISACPTVSPNITHWSSFFPRHAFPPPLKLYSESQQPGFLTLCLML